MGCGWDPSGMGPGLGEVGSKLVEALGAEPVQDRAPFGRGLGRVGPDWSVPGLGRGGAPGGRF